MYLIKTPSVNFDRCKLAKDGKGDGLSSNLDVLVSSPPFPFKTRSDPY